MPVAPCPDVAVGVGYSRNIVVAERDSQVGLGQVPWRIRERRARGRVFAALQRVAQAALEKTREGPFQLEFHPLRLDPVDIPEHVQAVRRIGHESDQVVDAVAVHRGDAAEAGVKRVLESDLVGPDRLRFQPGIRLLRCSTVVVVKLVDVRGAERPAVEELERRRRAGGVDHAQAWLDYDDTCFAGEGRPEADHAAVDRALEIAEAVGATATISRSSGVDVITADGLAAALDGVETVIDTATGPSPAYRCACGPRRPRRPRGAWPCRLRRDG